MTMDSNVFIEISLDGKRFGVKLNPKHEYYRKAYILVRGLLTAYERGDNYWVIGWDDLDFLKNRLDQFGLIDGRRMTKEAFDFYQWIQSIYERRQYLKDGKNNKEMEKLLKGKLKTQPYDDQISAISLAYENGRIGVFDTMGMGKSLEALGTIVAHRDAVKRSLVVCPLNVVPGIEREVKKHTYLHAVALPTGKKRALTYLEKVKDDDWDILVTHPENLIGTKNETVGDITKLLLTIPFDLIWVDEFHLYKNVDAKRTKCVLSLIDNVKARNGKKPKAVLTTGTPISENPVNAYTVLCVLSFVPNYIRFENHFCEKATVDFGSKGKHKIITGYKNLPDLKCMVERVSIRRTKEEMHGFPDEIVVQRDVFLKGKQKKLYNAIAKDLIHSLDQKSRINLENLFVQNNKALRLRQAVNHPGVLEEDGDSAKYIELDNILQELLSDPQQKVVIWTEYRKAVDLLCGRYNDEYGALKLYGGVNINEELIERFEQEEKPRIAVAIPAKAGVGTDFLARARTSIYIDRPYSYVNYKQSLDRINRRIGPNGPQTELDRIRAQPATLMFLDSVGTIDELVRSKLYDKDKLNRALTTSDEKLVEIGRADLVKYLRELR